MIGRATVAGDFDSSRKSPRVEEHADRFERRAIAWRMRSSPVCPRISTGLHMASLDWSQCPVVESIPGKVSGAWVFRGTRVPVSAIFENLKCSSLDEVLENFHVTRDQVQAVLDFAAKSAVPPGEPSRAA